MKSINLIIVIVLLILSYSVVFADATGISTSLSVTDTQKSSDNAGSNKGNTTSQSTTYTTTTSTTTNSSDDDIVSAIYNKYAKEPALIGTTLTVSSQNAIVTISGTVTAQSQADEAVIAAKSVVGVKDVRSSIKVATNPALNQPAKTPNY